MREIGVRELKANLSQVLHRIEEGEQVKVTLRGRHVADLVPAGSSRSAEQLRQLAAAGRLARPARPRPAARPRPLATGRSASAIVLDERDDER